MDAWNVLEKINKARGMGSSDQCYTVLYAVARAFNVRKIVEVGTHRGASAIVMSQAILDNGYIPDIHTVDNYRMYTDYKYDVIKQEAIDNVKQAGMEEYITLYDGFSGDWLIRIFDMVGKVDMCFLDGDYLDEGIISDYLMCEPHTNLIVFHSTGEGNCSYFDLVRSDGFSIIPFPTQFVEHDRKLIGISVAHRASKNKKRVK